MVNSTGNETESISTIVTVVYNMAITVVGLPVNFMALSHLFQQAKDGRTTRLLMLSMNVTASNLLMILFGATGKAIWHITYTFHGNNALCKIFKFLESLPAYVISFLTVSIAVDMLLVLKFPFRSGLNRAKMLIAGSWVLGMLASTPQLFYFQLLVFQRDHEYYYIRQQCVNVYVDEYGRLAYPAIVYQAVHLITVFWIPLLILLPCYIYILVIIYRHAQRRAQLMQANLQSSSETDSSSKHQTGLRSSPGSRRSSFLNSSSDDSPRRMRSLNLNPETQQRKPSFINPVMKTAMQLTVPMVNQSRLQPPPMLSQPQTPQAAVKRQVQKALKLASAVIGLYICTWLPYQILAMMAIMIPSTHQSIDPYSNWVYSLYLFNSCLNPLVYALRVRPDRSFVGSMLAAQHYQMLRQVSHKMLKATTGLQNRKASEPCFGDNVIKANIERRFSSFSGTDPAKDIML